ncbi:hypothetical protein K3M67_20125 (plasmid) [Sphingobium sp. V4]|uniref:hypothetical protein n=1 Tax=Sphingobium sp. V4 TaxID=3038927 RepID=UPI002557DFA6|nr:hypothetical protein [Sphingobium sp. V4]WIW91111.1 hypothetical protein K3M67_20125 [Sphingobium sp. V4]
MATTDTQTTDDVPDETEVQENVEKGEDKDPNPLAPPINTQGGSSAIAMPGGGMPSQGPRSCWSGI